MRQTKEVLRLSAQGLTNAEIAQSLGLGKTTIKEYRERARQAGVTWPLPDGLDDAALDRLLFHRPELSPARPVPEWAEVHRELKRHKHATLQLLWIEYRQDHPDGWGYTQFCVHYRDWLERQDVVMRLTYAAGERMFVDYAGDTQPITDPKTGEIWQAQVFVAVLGASGLMYVEALRAQDLGSWPGAHARCFHRYGGVAKITVPDNLKSGVTKACCYDPVINPSYLEAGLASGLLTTSQQIGGALGLAVLVTIATERATSLLAGGDSPGAAQVAGARTAFGVGACLVVAGAIVALTCIGQFVPASLPAPVPITEEPGAG